MDKNGISFELKKECAYKIGFTISIKNPMVANNLLAYNRSIRRKQNKAPTI
jgi:hypothetical protein